MASIFNAIASLFGYLLNYIYNVVGNYGIAIILFTILTKLILLPLTIKQQKSLALSQKMQPILNDLQKRYKNDQTKLTEEYQKLMKENKFNPFGGCLLSLIQIPIIIGMLYVVGKPLTNMIKMDPIKIREEIVSIMPIPSEENQEEISEEEYEKRIDEFIKANMYIELQVIKEKNLLDLTFLGINLGDIASVQKTDYKLLIIPILSAVSTYFSLNIINQKKKKEEIELKKEEESEIVMPNMKVMNSMMPVMSGFIAYIVPQGLGLYWFSSGLIQILQHVLIEKYISRNDDNKNELTENK